MKKLQLLLAVLLVGNFVNASEEQSAEYQSQRVKRKIEQMIPLIISADEASQTKEADSLYSLKTKTEFKDTAFKLEQGLEMNIDAEWSQLNQTWKLMGAMTRLQSYLLYDLADVATQKESDTCIDRFASGYKECYVNVQNNELSLPECLKRKLKK